MLTSFTFTPKSDEEIMAQNLLQPGIGQYEVMSAILKMSKSGNPMIEMKIKVWDAAGSERIIYDYLINMPSMEFKIKHFCESCGLDEKYKDGRFTDMDCVQKSGRLRIGIQKDKSGNNYPDRNCVVDYIKHDPTLMKKEEFADDDLPF